MTEIVEWWKEDQGLGWMQVEDEEERMAAYIEWFNKKCPKKTKGKPVVPTLMQQKYNEMRASDPVLDKML